MLHIYRLPTEYVDSSNHHLIAIYENLNTYYLVGCPTRQYRQRI